MAPRTTSIPVYDVPLPRQRSTVEIPATPVVLPSTVGAPAGPMRPGGGFSSNPRGLGFEPRASQVESSGFSGSVRFTNGDSSFALGINTAACADLWHRSFCQPAGWTNSQWCSPYRPYWNGWCGASSWYGWYPWSYYGYYGYYEPYPVINTSYVMNADPALATSYSPSAPQPAVAAAPAPQSEFELASLYMQSKRFGEAATAFRAALRADPGDAPAHRWLGISLLMLGRTQDGCAEVFKAYAADPTLADSSPDLESMGLTERETTELCAPVVAYSQRGRSPAGYVTAAMLMQIRSRPDYAAKMLSGARDAGLEHSLAVKLNDAMTR